MTSRVTKLLPAVFLTFAIVGYAADSNVTSRSAAASSGLEPIGVEMAFRKALGSIKARANLMDPKAEFTITRTASSGWMLRPDGLPDLPSGGVSVFVGDSGSVQITLTNTNSDARAWLSSGAASKPDPTMSVRPEVAFRQAIEALAKWWQVAPESFRSPDSRAVLARREKEWQLTTHMPSARTSPEWRVVVRDDGNIESYPHKQVLGL